MKRLLSTLLALGVIISSTNGFAFDEQKLTPYTISVEVGEKLSFGTWCKRMTGDQDPGLQGVKHTSKDLAFDKLEWIDGSFKHPTKKWYAIFIGMDASQKYALSVQTTSTGNDDVDKGILLTFDSVPPTTDNGKDGDYYTNPFGDFVGGQSKPLADEAIPSAKAATYASAVNSLYELKGTGKEVYSNALAAGPVNRIIRCYVSIFQYFDGNTADGKTKNDVLDTKTNIDAITTGNLTGLTGGSITFTMSPK